MSESTGTTSEPTAGPTSEPASEPAAEVPEILFRLSESQILTIQLPELLAYTVQEQALSQLIIVGDETTFIFPGAIVKTAETALWIPVSSFNGFDHPASPDVALAFDVAGQHLELSSGDVSNFGGQEQILCKQPLDLTGDVSVFDGSLLRTTHGGLYYLPIGAFETLTSIDAAVAAANADNGANAANADNTDEEGYTAS